MHIVDVTVPDENWESTGSDDDMDSRLLTTLCINGVHHHAEAISVTEKDGVQEATDPTFEDEFRAVWTYGGTDGRFQTVEIKNREYILVITPFC